MQKNLCTLLNVAKDDSSKMLQAINLFSPLIQKYSKKLFFIDREDAECISFINKGLYRRFCVLCKENPQNAEMTTDFISLPNFEFEERYPDIDLICDYQKHLEKLPSIYTEIFHLLNYTFLSSTLTVSRKR